MKRTSVFSPEQNGISERLNRTAVEAVRSMLNDSGLKTRFWAEALHCYVHVKNRTGYKLLMGKIPFEMLYGYEPSVRHLKSFGSLAYVHIPKIKRKKREANTKFGILSGYAQKCQGYRVGLPKERTTVEIIHVNIDENKNGVKTFFRTNSGKN